MIGVTRVDLGRVEVVSMRELTLNTAAVIQRLRAEGVPRVVVKHGRFQAALWPLPVGVEADLLSSAVNSGEVQIGDANPKGLLAHDLIQDSDASETQPQSVGAALETVEQLRRADQTFAVATMSELSQNPSAVIERVRAGERLVVTRHGRWVALLVPLPPSLESQLLAAVPDFMGTLNDGKGEFSSGKPADVAQAWSTG